MGNVSLNLDSAFEPAYLVMVHTKAILERVGALALYDRCLYSLSAQWPLDFFEWIPGFCADPPLTAVFRILKEDSHLAVYMLV